MKKTKATGLTVAHKATTPSVPAANDATATPSVPNAPTMLKPQLVKLTETEQKAIQRVRTIYASNYGAKLTEIDAAVAVLDGQRNQLVSFKESIQTAQNERIQGLIEGFVAGGGTDMDEVLYAIPTQDPSVMAVMMKPKV